MSLIKVPLILTDALGMRITATPPNPPSKISYNPIVPNWREKFLRSLSWPAAILRVRLSNFPQLDGVTKSHSQILTWVAGLIEILVIIARCNPAGLISSSILRAAALNERCPTSIRITPFFLVGNICTLVGTLLRIKCYRALGRMFTFELSIQPGHKLVIEGPYAVIRHPSYSAMILTIIGAFCSNAEGSWVSECGILDSTLGRALAVYWLCVASSVVLSLVLRVPNEDRLLEAEFGDEWTAWSQRVRYKLIPGVY